MRLTASCLVLVSLLAVAAVPARADQNDARLEKLFSQLKKSADGPEAYALSSLIWRIWRQTEDGTVTRVMARGVTAMSRGRYPEALTAFDEVVRIAPRFAEGWNKRATVHYLMNNHDASIRDIGRTLRLEPRHFGAISGLGLNYLSLGREKQALDAFVKALEINPHLGDARLYVEKLREKLGGRAI